MLTLTASELKQRMEGDAAPLLLDVREDWEYRHARIDGSLHIPMGEIPGRAGELAPEAEIVVICHHGMRSAQVAHYLNRLGFTSVYNLTGGIDAWSREVDPEVPLY